MNVNPKVLLLAMLPFMGLPPIACSQQEKTVTPAASQSVSDPLVNAVHEASRVWLKVVGVAEGDTLNVRLKPTSQAQVVTVLPFDEVNVLKLSEQGKWVEVSYKGLSGWVYSSYVKPSKHVSVSHRFSAELKCFGGEPHWSLATDGEKITYGIQGSDAVYFLNSKFREGLNRNNIWYGHLSQDNAPGRFMTVIIEKTQACSDDMSDVNHPFSISIIDADAKLTSGCCRI